MFLALPLEVSIFDAFVVVFLIPASIFAAIVLFFWLIIRLVRRISSARLERGYNARREAQKRVGDGGDRK